MYSLYSRKEILYLPDCTKKDIATDSSNMRDKDPILLIQRNVDSPSLLLEMLLCYNKCGDYI